MPRSLSLMGTNKKTSAANESDADSILEALNRYDKVDASKEASNPLGLQLPGDENSSESEEAKLKKLLEAAQIPDDNPFQTQLASDSSNFSAFAATQKGTEGQGGSLPSPPTFTKVNESQGVSTKKPFEDMSLLYTEVASKISNVFSQKQKEPSFVAEENAPVIPSADRPSRLESAPVEGTRGIQASLYENEHLKMAQRKIEKLESEIEKLRIENERLASAGELFQKKAEESIQQRYELEKKSKSSEDRYVEERRSLFEKLETRENRIKDLEDRVSDFESRIANDVRRSRTRERELENRLELARLERLSLVGSKDEIILDLKRQIDLLNQEISNYRKKAAEMARVIEEDQEQFRRTVRALRLALTNLEVNEQSGARVKKAE